VFYLEAPLDVLLQRCAAQTAGPVRPLLKDATALFQRRAGLYAASGELVSTAGRSPDQVASHIAQLLQIR
jgi:shikimate kinase